MPRRTFLGLLVAPFLGAPACPPEPPEIARERAIEIARAQLRFEPLSTEAVKAKEDGRKVWRVTFRGRPAGAGHPIREILVVVIDRATGEVLSLAKS